MGDATPGMDAKPVAFASGTGSGTNGKLNKSDVYSATSEEVDGCNSLNAPNGYNALDSTDFGDEAENVELGLKTGEWTMEGNYQDAPGTGLKALDDAHDSGDKVEVGYIIDETVAASGDAKGKEMTVYVTNFEESSTPDGKTEFSATLQCADGKGWNRLA